MKDGGTRLFYQGEGDERKVILQKDHEIVGRYESPEQLVEAHIKGLMAKDRKDAEYIESLMKRYRPDQFPFNSTAGNTSDDGD